MPSRLEQQCSTRPVTLNWLVWNLCPLGSWYSVGTIFRKYLKVPVLWSQICWCPSRGCTCSRRHCDACNVYNCQNRNPEWRAGAMLTWPGNSSLPKDRWWNTWLMLIREVSGATCRHSIYHQLSHQGCIDVE